VKFTEKYNLNHEGQLRLHFRKVSLASQVKVSNYIFIDFNMLMAKVQVTKIWMFADLLKDIRQIFSFKEFIQLPSAITNKDL
jgi:hypothetical protein